MGETVVKEVLIRAIKEREESGDIVVVNTGENATANKLHELVQ